MRGMVEREGGAKRSSAGAYHFQDTRPMMEVAAKKMFRCANGRGMRSGSGMRMGSGEGLNFKSYRAGIRAPDKSEFSAARE